MSDPIDLTFDPTRPINRSDRLFVTRHVNLRDPTLMGYFRQIVDRQAEGSLKPIGARNKFTEKIGEDRALDYIRRKFPGTKPVIIASRPNGVPILDLVLSTDDGRIIVVECKFSSTGTPKLGNNRLMWTYVEGEGFDGWKATRVAKGEIIQMSPRWMVNRVSELDRIGQRHTAVQMVRALRAGRIHAVTIVVDSTGEILENAIIDHTHEWVRAFSGPNPEIKLPSWIGESELPHVGNPAVKNRLGPSAAVADAGEAGALASGEGRSIAVREGAEVAVREGAEVASQRIALRTAARTVGRVLVAVIGRLLMALDVLGLAFLITEIVGVLVAYFSDRAIERAIEKATRTNIPVEIKAALDQYKDEIARHFARAWHNKKNADDAIFLYLSPRLVIEGGLGNDGFVFTVSVPVKSFEKDLVSTRFIEPNRKDIVPLGPTYYNIEIRWSAEQPIFTPFDIYLAFTEYFVEHVVDSWTMHYANNVKLAPSTVELFRSTVEILAEISATLKFEPWFGSDGLDFPTSKVGVARWKALQELSVTIDKRLITKVSALETKKLINTSSVRWDAYWSPLRAEFRPSGEGSLLPTMRKIANEMKYLQAKDLGYERFETMEAKQRARRGLTRPFTGNPIEAQKELDLREYLKPVAHRLPKSAVSSQPLLEVSEEHAARLVLDPFDR